MTRHKLVVLSEPTIGQEDEYNRWYNEVHLADVVRVPGFVSAQRFKLHTPVSGQFPHRYLSIYEIDCESPEPVLAGLGAAASGGAMTMSTALNVESAIAGLFEPISGVVAAPARTPA